MGSSVQDVTARAKQLISERKYRDAVRACRRVLLSKPDAVPVRLLLAQALLALGRHDEVRIEMLALSKKAPDVGAAWRLLGEAYIRGGQPDAAAEALREALKLDPADDEARDLLEEVGEVDAPPKMETIDRWFGGEPTHAEARIDEIRPPDEQAPPATGPSIDAPASVELDPEFEAEATSAEHDVSGLPSAPPTPSPAKPRKRTLLGLPAAPRPGAARPPGAGLPSAPPPPGMPKPSAPPPPGVPKPSAPPPPGVSKPSAPPPRHPRPPKRTVMGFGAAPPAPAPAPTPASPGTEELDLDEAMVDDGGTAELSPDDLLSASGTSPLSTDDLAPIDSDPYADLGEGLPPLEGDATQARGAEVDDLPGEPTQGRPPVHDGFGGGDVFDEGLPPLAGEATMARAPEDFEDEGTRPAKGLRAAPPGAPPPAAPADFEEETTAARGQRYAEDDPEDFETTTTRPAVDAEFPSDEIDTGLPPLEGEPTMARQPPEAPSLPGLGAPNGFRPSATPQPAGAPAPAASVSPPAGALPAATPADTRAARPTAKTDEMDATRGAGPPGRTVKLGRFQLSLPVLVALAGVPVLLIVAIVAGVHAYLGGQAEEAIAAAAAQASQDGLESSLRAALELDAEERSDDGPAVARRARLYAMAAHDHGFQETERALALLDSLDTEGLGSADAKVAQVYLALEAGRPRDAADTALLLDGTALDGEAGYARALAAYARGELERAEVESGALMEIQGQSPRYAALRARILAESEQIADALATLQALPNLARSPVARLAKARVHVLAEQPQEALEETAALLEELGSALSARQRAFALLSRAEASLQAGQREQAAALAEEATNGRPTGDESFGLRLAELQLRLGALDAARNLLEALPEERARPAQHARVAAEIHLAAGDLAAVEEVLERAGETPQTAYLHGRLAEARGDGEEAERQYRTAAEEPSEYVRATARLGVLALREGEAEQAIEVLEPARAQAPGHAEIVPALIEAYLEEDQLDEAARVATEALEARPEAAELLIAKGRVDLARGEVDAVLAALAPLVDQRPEDADLHAMIGEAARRKGQAERANAAFDRALAVDATQRTALLGKALVALDAGDVEAAQEAITKAREGRVGRRTVAVLEARRLVLEGIGNEAARQLRRLVRRSRDADLWAAYGRALAQAESDRAAENAFERALRYDEDQVEAHLGLALVRTRRGALSGAASAIGEAARVIDAKELGSRWEARLLAARGRLLFENGAFGDAERKAREALEKDEDCAEAHLLLAVIADAQGGDPVPELRRALAARSPAPEVLGQLVIFDRRADDRCELAQRYMRAAPRGIDARDVRAVARRCR